MHDLLGLSPVFTDRTRTGKMRDAYPIAFFRLCLVIGLFQERLWSQAVYLIPRAFAITALDSDAIAKETRVFLRDGALRHLTYFDLDGTEGVLVLKEQ
jgi:hypothetical protein